MHHLPLITTQALAVVKSKQVEVSNALRRRLDIEQVETTCHKGCNHCCHYPINISLFEGVLLYQWLHKEGLWTSALRKQCEEHSRTVLGLPIEVWLLTKIPCPLLQDNLCLAYTARPTVCRTTWSTKMPDLCKAENFGLAPLVSREAEWSEFQRTEKTLYKKHDVKYRTLPVSLALLLGARIATGDLELSGSDREVLRHYLEDS